MELNPDCIRDVLLTVESAPFDERITLKYLQEKCPAYTSDELTYTCLKLEEGGYLDIITVRISGSQFPSIKSINSLTFCGHEFLNNIREKTTWEKTKTVAGKVGSFSLDTLKSVSSGVIASLIKSQLNM